MTTQKTSALKTFFRYLGRGAVPVDGIYWVANSSERAPTGTKALEPRGLNVPVGVCSPHLDKCAPAARGT